VSFVALLLIAFPKILVRYKMQLNPEDVIKLDSLVSLMEMQEHHETNYFMFDPNILPVDSLVLLGIPQKVAERLENYRNKRGRFIIKKDIKKIYGFSDQLYHSISEYITLPDSILTRQKRLTHFDINEAGSEQLERISGIGPELAQRILRFREVLGGFISEEQFNEVYQLEGQPLYDLKKYAFIGGGYTPKRIKINQASIEELGAHPYITKRCAEDIVRFRNVNGAIESEKLLANFKSVDKDSFEKLILYLDFE
jgi:DNA uptake protein ComE-like DNA-binding protein